MILCLEPGKLTGHAVHHSGSRRQLANPDSSVKMAVRPICTSVCVCAYALVLGLVQKIIMSATEIFE